MAFDFGAVFLSHPIYPLNFKLVLVNLYIRLTILADLFRYLFVSQIDKTLNTNKL